MCPFGKTFHTIAIMLFKNLHLETLTPDRFFSLWLIGELNRITAAEFCMN